MYAVQAIAQTIVTTKPDIRPAIANVIIFSDVFIVIVLID